MLQDFELVGSRYLFSSLFKMTPFATFMVY